MGYCNIPVNDDYEVPEDIPTIRSSQGKDVDSSSVGWMEPVDLWDPLKEMRKRYNRHGYIWIKNLLPREDVLAMREQSVFNPPRKLMAHTYYQPVANPQTLSYFHHLSPTGLLAPNTQPRDGIFNPSNDLSDEERVSAFNKHMADVGYLSHDAEGSRRTQTKGQLKWLVGDFEAVDVVFHTPHMIQPNEDEKGRIRLGSDLRFCEAGAPVDGRWCNLWMNGDKL